VIELRILFEIRVGRTVRQQRDRSSMYIRARHSGPRASIACRPLANLLITFASQTLDYRKGRLLCAALTSCVQQSACARPLSTFRPNAAVAPTAIAFTSSSSTFGSTRRPRRQTYLQLLYGRTPPTLAPRSGEKLAAEAVHFFGDRRCIEGLHEISVAFRHAPETSEPVR
jgi:hypothetical protein